MLKSKAATFSTPVGQFLYYLAPYTLCKCLIVHCTQDNQAHHLDNAYINRLSLQIPKMHSKACLHEWETLFKFNWLFPLPGDKRIIHVMTYTASKIIQILLGRYFCTTCVSIPHCAVALLWKVVQIDSTVDFGRLFTLSCGSRSKDLHHSYHPKVLWYLCIAAEIFRRYMYNESVKTQSHG